MVKNKEMLLRHCFSTFLEFMRLGQWLEIKLYNQLFVYADDVNIMDGSVHNTKKHSGFSIC